LTAQGHPRAIFNRAIERGNLLVAEATTRELGGRISLEEALRLVFLYADQDPRKFERAPLRWHVRYVSEATPSMLRVQVAFAALSALATDSEPAKKVLIGLVANGSYREACTAHG
jgi:hypothetical protein